MSDLKSNVKSRILLFLKKVKMGEVHLEEEKKKVFLSFLNQLKRLEQQLLECTELELALTGDETNLSSVRVERDLLESEIDAVVLELKEKILEAEKLRDKKVLLEIRAGTGGKEACLFAREVYAMYAKFFEKKKWRTELVESRVDEEGGFSFVSALVKGKGAFLALKNEAGVHRVQRVPKTENKGRIHTSTISLVVIPEREKISVTIRPQDLRIETFRNSGKGGQRVNKVETAVRVTHVPTGTVVVSREGRDQITNRINALSILETRILEKVQREEQEKNVETRQSMIGNSERSEKIRTYNWPQNRITDHRLEITWNKLDIIMSGGELEEITQSLVDWDTIRTLERMEKGAGK